MRIEPILACLLLSAPLNAQGFAGMGTDAEGFSTPQPEPDFDFPADHGPHPDYRIEWWYLTANLDGPNGTEYGLQWTLFRSALAPGEAAGWQSPQVWFAHAAVTTPDRHFSTERFARGGIGQAGVIADPFEAWIDDWHMQGDSLGNLSLTATAPDFSYDMTLQAQGPLVFHGQNGFSVKSPQGQASYYYSQPFYEISGTLDLPEGAVEVTGSAWLDREWSSQPLSENQTGWDWFSLTFQTGEKMMGFRLREDGGDPFTAGTWITPDGQTTALDDGALRASPIETTAVAGRDVPTAWRLTLPARDLDIEVRALNGEAWMDTSVPYWEGPVHVSGSHSGRGYLEMTGYD
ncbi:lipocalin-like domain-containing protein [Roseovarius tibetensis]|uniref:lipocalin-like domain-containing protein n=1 Tax=Roseovarius tibetensis TaxID=2685897 RepID=UPI003D7F22D3